MSGQRVVNDNIMSFFMCIIIYLGAILPNQEMPNTWSSQICLLSTVILGVLIGILVSGITSFRELKIIERKGESRFSLMVILALMVPLLTVLIVFMYVSLYVYPNIISIQLLFDFIAPIFPAFLLMQTVVYFRWERKNKTKLFIVEGKPVGTVMPNSKIEKPA